MARRMVMQSTVQFSHCPRCGYDLRGTVATWVESCPLTGVCTECGLSFEWAELLSDTVRKPRWSVEYCPRRSVPRRVITTLACSFVPWKFWRELRMSHPTHASRMLAFAIGCTLALAVIVFASHAWYVWQYWREFVSRPGTTPVSMYIALVEPLLQPLAHESVIERQGGGFRSIGLNDYPTPLEQLESHFVPSTAPILVPILAGVLTLMFMPATFLILPVSRKRAKVRWRHIGRIALYSAALLLPFVAGAAIAEAPYEGRMHYFYRIHPVYPSPSWYQPIALVLSPLVGVTWWFFAIRHYLRMSESVILTISVGTLAVLAASAVYLLLDMAIFL